MKIEPSTRVLVTGANGGIGQSICRALFATGAHIVASSRHAEEHRPPATEIVVADLSDRRDLQRLIAAAGDIDVLVSCAGLPGSGDVMEYSEAQIDRALEVNLRAPIVLARQLGEGMRTRGRGHIVFISSLSGKIAPPRSAMYAATKFGLRGFALSLRQDLHGSGVGVTAVFPGFIRNAGMFASSKIKLPFGAGTRTPEAVAAAVLRAIRHNPAEINVTSFDQSLGLLIGALSPAWVASVQRWLGADKIAKALSDRQRDQR
jgi:short-subunit dehydrogenase